MSGLKRVVGESVNSPLARSATSVSTDHLNSLSMTKTRGRSPKKRKSDSWKEAPEK